MHVYKYLNTYPTRPVKIDVNVNFVNLFLCRVPTLRDSDNSTEYCLKQKKIKIDTIRK